MVKSVCQIESRCRGKPLLALRKQHCFRLVRKFKNGDKIRCNVCSLEQKTTQGTKGNFYYLGVMRHALLHLKNCLYYCKKCSYSTKTSHSIKRHVQLAHDNRKATENDYDDRSDELQNEILETISKGYDHWIKIARSRRSKRNETGSGESQK